MLPAVTPVQFAWQTRDACVLLWLCIGVLAFVLAFVFVLVFMCSVVGWVALCVGWDVELGGIACNQTSHIV